MNLETKITIYKFTPQVFTLTPKDLEYLKKQRRTRNHFLILPQFGGSWRIRTAVHGFADR